MTQSERRLAAIMFTDLVGFSAMTQQNEALALELVSTKRQLLNPLLDQHGGTLVKTMGDGFLVEFSSALGAVGCAISIQSMLYGFNKAQPQGNKIELRIGIHVGDVHSENDDIFGDGVNIASRIEPLAEPSGICVTRNVREYVDGKLEAEFESIGTPDLKNIQMPIEVYKIIPHWQSEAATNETQSVSTPIPAKSVAVLPFDNLSADAENEYFSDGLTEDILTKLCKVRDLKVISRTSIMLYKGIKRNLKDIGRELGVATVVEGSVRKAGNQVRITAQLINAFTDDHLWADSYDRELENIFEVQTEVAEKIVEALQANITSEEREQLTTHQTENTDAYQLYLQGLHHWSQRTDEDMGKSIECFQSAIEIDPNYALAYVGLADAHLIRDNFGPNVGTEEIIRLSSQAIEKALELDSNLGEAHTSLGQIKSKSYDWAGSNASFQKAIELNPNYATAHHWYGLNLGQQAKHDAAIEELHKALELDPLSLIIQCNIALTLFLRGDYEESALNIRNIHGKFPDSQLVVFYLITILAITSEYDEALSLQEKLVDGRGRKGSMDWASAWIYALKGDHLRAYEILTDLLEEYEDRLISPVNIGTIYLALGKHDRAIDYLWKGYERRDRLLSYLKVFPGYDPIREEPRFIELLEKVGLAN
jgi:TolB-like protein